MTDNFVGFLAYQFRVLKHIPSIKYHTVRQEFQETYAQSNLNDKVVIDVGADIGITPSLFIKHGAKKVIAYSLDRQSNKYVDRAVEWRGKWTGELPKGDIFKIDCEGCEYVLDSPDKIIELYPEWYIAIHILPDYQKTKSFLSWYDQLAQQGRMVYHNGNEYMFHGVSGELKESGMK